MTVKKHYKEIDILRGTAILMVLLYHSIIVYPIDLHTITWCRQLHEFLWVIQMPLFFLISGFCYSYQGHYGSYLSKKCKRILIPHIVFSALDIIPRIISNPLVHEQMDLKEALTDFLFYGGSDWFLWVLFVISAMFPLIEHFLNQDNLYKILGVIIIAEFFISKEDMTDFFLFNMISQYLLYYLLGWILHEFSDKLIKLVERKRNLLLSALGTGVFFAGYLAFSKNRYLELLCALCAAAFFLRLSRFYHKKTADFLSACGKYSLQMYLLDAYALVLTRTVLVNMLGIENSILIICSNFFADTLLVYLISKYVLTKAKVFRILCGM